MHLIFKDYFVSGFKRRIETVISHDIPRQASIAAESVSMGFLAGKSRSAYFGAIRHNDRIGHMRFRRGVEYGDIDTVMNDIEHRCDQYARLPAHRFAGLEIDVDVVTRFEFADQRNEFFSVVSFLGDMVSAAEIDPLHMRYDVAEFRFERCKDFFECVAVLFAKSVKMESLDLR